MSEEEEFKEYSLFNEQLAYKNRIIAEQLHEATQKKEEMATTNQESTCKITGVKGKLMKECRDFIENVPFRNCLDEISQHVIGQNEGVALLLVGIYNYVKGIAKNGEPPKTNMLLAAPTGSGKTETYRALKKYFARYIPTLVMDLVDLSNITVSGFKGKDPWTIITKLIQAGTSYGIIWLDEADKRMIKSSTSSGENVSAEIQSQLLSLIEGVEDSYQTKSMNAPVRIDTSETLFIASGSFGVVRERKKESKAKTIGFITTEDAYYDVFDEITREDIISLGCIRELLARFALIINYHKLSHEAVKKIIELNRNKVAEELGITIHLSDDFLEEAFEKNNGEFGCRLLISMIYQPCFCACKEALLQGIEQPEVVLHREGKFELLKLVEGQAENELEQENE